METLQEGVYLLLSLWR